MNDRHEPDGLSVAVSHLNKLNQRQDFFETVAQTMRNYYDALVRAGFTEDQATQIVAGFAAKPDK
jgi:hypothetical protein